VFLRGYAFVDKHIGWWRFEAGSSAGRERLFEFDLGPVGEMKEYLNFVLAKWDEALGRLKVFVEG
jgi:hypothetical protein